MKYKQVEHDLYRGMSTKTASPTERPPSIEVEGMSRGLPWWLEIGPICWDFYYNKTNLNGRWHGV